MLGWQDLQGRVRGEMVLAATRRLGSLVRQLKGSESHELGAAQLAVSVPSAAASTPSRRAQESASLPAVLDSVQKQHLREFISRGVTIVGPEEHGLPTEVHKQVWENLKAGHSGDGIGTRMPEIVEVLNSPGMVRALNAIMGEDWAIVPFIHSGFGGAGPNDQTWCATCSTQALLGPPPHHPSYSLRCTILSEELVNARTCDSGTKTIMRTTMPAKCAITAQCSWKFSIVSILRAAAKLDRRVPLLCAGTGSVGCS